MQTAESATKQSPRIDELVKESQLLKFDTTKEIAQEPPTELKDQSKEIPEEPSTEEVNTEVYERASTKLRFRAKTKDNTSSPLEPPEKLPLHRGPSYSSLAIFFGVSAVIVLFLVSFGLWGALDLGVA